MRRIAALLLALNTSCFAMIDQWAGLCTKPSEVSSSCRKAGGSVSRTRVVGGYNRRGMTMLTCTVATSSCVRVRRYVAEGGSCYKLDSEYSGC